VTETGSTGRIVVGVDGSPESALALSWAARVARAEHAGIDVVAAWEFAPSLGWTASDDYLPERAIRQAALATVRETFGPAVPADLRMITQEGNPAAVLVERSATAIMIIVGSRGHGALMGWLRGSVSARVAGRAQCPVVVVRGPRIPDAPDFDITSAETARRR
jgi:nucleotide-binding universal stress UspA family protein